jgi:hypothetical protein
MIYSYSYKSSLFITIFSWVQAFQNYYLLDNVMEFSFVFLTVPPSFSHKGTTYEDVQGITPVETENDMRDSSPML